MKYPLEYDLAAVIEYLWITENFRDCQLKSK